MILEDKPTELALDDGIDFLLDTIDDYFVGRHTRRRFELQQGIVRIEFLQVLAVGDAGGRPLLGGGLFRRGARPGDPELDLGHG
ncbi:MAG: hypothetical protein EPO55_25075 [Reyranella sp.]|uniref:hypothetical protein n=1 Tax=Reyranella sp. TaxID=1929291 RepID=UPI00120B0F76|nr:hypothetical protein [Reyranella sp.]TAJ35735.1 MAG: hypothetical protein EPO55_25075 [Reyranella sp.]